MSTGELTDRMFEMLDYAVKYRRTNAWHEIGRAEEDAEAAMRLAEVGLIEVRGFSNQYRVTP